MSWEWIVIEWDAGIFQCRYVYQYLKKYQGMKPTVPPKETESSMP